MKTVPEHIIEPLIIRLAFTEAKLTNLLNRVFNECWFTSTINARFVTLMCQYYTKYNTLPTIDNLELMVQANFNGSEFEHDAMVSLSAIRNLDITQYSHDFLMDESLKYIKHVGLYSTLMNSFDEIEKTQEIICWDDLTNISNLSYDSDLGLDYFNVIDDHIIELGKPDYRTSTGWITLDRYTNNGFYTEGRCLATFVAETGMGKSLMLSNIAANWLKMNKFVVIVSLEMSETVYATRIDAHLSRISMGAISESLNQLGVKLHEFKRSHFDAKLVIKEYPPDSISCSEIRTFIDSLVVSVGRKPDIILVDYINLLKPRTGSKNDNSYARIGTVSQDLRALSYLYKAPVVSATQCNREGYGTTDPAINNISDSMGIGFVSDFVGQLYQNDGDREAGVLNMKITKNRFGGIINKHMTFDVDYGNLIISDSTRPTISDDLSECVSAIEED
jgi:hypothetical protein